MASNRIKITGVLTGKYSFERVPFCGYGTETINIYKITDEEGKVYVWKTGSILEKIVYTEEETYIEGWGRTWTDGRGRNYYCVFVTKGSKITVSASVKGESEYKGEPQTEITRVKVEEIHFRAESEAEKAARIEAEEEAKKAEQLASIREEDLVWRMPYKQYKEHYADCETVIGSFERKTDSRGYVIEEPTIEVIIREGRLKNSGVRGKHFAGYRIRFTLDGKQYINPYRAVSETTAIRQAKREFPKATDFECVEIVHYQGRNWNF